jgi:hypothetical protein
VCCPLRPGPLNPQLAGNILPASQSYVARGDILDEKNSLALSLKAEIERRSSFEKLWGFSFMEAFVTFRMYKCAKIMTPYHRL